MQKRMIVTSTWFVTDATVGAQTFFFSDVHVTDPMHIAHYAVYESLMLAEASVRIACRKQIHDSQLDWMTTRTQLVESHACEYEAKFVGASYDDIVSGLLEMAPKDQATLRTWVAERTGNGNPSPDVIAVILSQASSQVLGGVEALVAILLHESEHPVAGRHRIPNI